MNIDIPAAVAALPRRAGWWRRFFAWLYEMLLLVPVLLLASIPSLAVQSLIQSANGLPVNGVIDTLLARSLNFVWELLVGFIYFAWCWRRGGQTLAMKTWRMRLVSIEGNAIGWRVVVIRFAAAFVCWFPLFPLWIQARHHPEWIPYAWFSLGLFLAPFFWSLIDRDRQYLHDRLAGTRLIFAPKQLSRAT
ncbi:RDD family protein [Andreprevotia chitinilytica]|uniref:RDD family protein n=1 Tax=Andreprevotia chitinilytica TaxID=396808 RepID=UPI00068BF61E|nr:RDD family protein [Andreprevotia chitinilytica]